MFKKFLCFVFALVVFFSVFPHQVFAQEEKLEGNVLEIVSEEKLDNPDFGAFLHQVVIVKVTKGSQVGTVLQVENQSNLNAGVGGVKVGDKVVITKLVGADGEDQYLITDYVRRSDLLFLFILFVTLVILVGRVWGVTSLIGMGFSFLVILVFILPRILAGDDPVLIAIIGSSVIIPVTFILSHGISKKTFVAGLSTVITLAVVGVLSAIFVEAAKLTGLASEEAGYLQSQIGNINVKGILLAGMIIATLGVLDDVTISQASTVTEIKRANPKLSTGHLFASAMRVGRDHIASLVNTLVLVYAGASLPLFLLFIENPKPFSEVINYEIIAEEVVRTLVGSIGLVLAVPITTALAVYYFNKK